MKTTLDTITVHYHLDESQIRDRKARTGARMGRFLPMEIEVIIKDGGVAQYNVSGPRVRNDGTSGGGAWVEDRYIVGEALPDWLVPFTLPHLENLLQALYRPAPARHPSCVDTLCGDPESHTHL